MNKIYIIVGDEVATKEVQSDFDTAQESLKGMQYDYLIHIDEDSVINIYDAINGDWICDPSISEVIVSELEEIVTTFAQSSDYDNSNVEEFLSEFSDQIEAVHERHLQEIQEEDVVMSTVQEVLTDYVRKQISGVSVNTSGSATDKLASLTGGRELMIDLPVNAKFSRAAHKNVIDPTLHWWKRTKGPYYTALEIITEEEIQGYIQLWMEEVGLEPMSLDEIDFEESGLSTFEQKKGRWLIELSYKIGPSFGGDDTNDNDGDVLDYPMGTDHRHLKDDMDGKKFEAVYESGDSDIITEHHWEDMILWLVYQDDDVRYDNLDEYVEEYLMKIDADYVSQLEDILELVREELEAVGIYLQDDE